MYQEKDKSYGIIALIYYIIYCFGLLLSGIMYRKGITHGMNFIYCLMFAAGVLIVLIKDKNIYNLGLLENEKTKTNLIISCIIIAVTFTVILIFSNLPLKKLIIQMLYYLFYIAVIEEILFRGLIQNYLFGFKFNRYLIFIIGAIFFSFMHIPFQMFRHNNVSLTYIIEAIPNLIETFIAHLIYCWVVCKRKDIYIPIAIHYAYNFLGIIV